MNFELLITKCQICQFLHSSYFILNQLFVCKKSVFAYKFKFKLIIYDCLVNKLINLFP